MTSSIIKSWFNEPRLGETSHFIIIADAYPVSRGHTLIVAKRDVATMLGLTQQECSDLHDAMALASKLTKCDGYNIGANCGAAAGQTVMRFHLHVIPRYAGDVVNPRGGVRGVIPEMQDYERDPNVQHTSVKSSPTHATCPVDIRTAKE